MKLQWSKEIMIWKTVWGYVNDYSQRLSDCHSQFFLKLSCEVFSFGNLNIQVEKFIKNLTVSIIYYRHVVTNFRIYPWWGQSSNYRNMDFLLWWCQNCGQLFWGCTPLINKPWNGKSIKATKLNLTFISCFWYQIISSEICIC